MAVAHWPSRPPRPADRVVAVEPVEVGRVGVRPGDRAGCRGHGGQDGRHESRARSGPVAPAHRHAGQPAAVGRHRHAGGLDHVELGHPGQLLELDPLGSARRSAPGVAAGGHVEGEGPGHLPLVGGVGPEHVHQVAEQGLERVARVPGFGRCHAPHATARSRPPVHRRRGRPGTDGGGPLVPSRSKVTASVGPRRVGIEAGPELGRRVDRVPVDGDDDVPGLEPGLRRPGCRSSTAPTGAPPPVEGARSSPCAAGSPGSWRRRRLDPQPPVVDRRPTDTSWRATPRTSSAGRKTAIGRRPVAVGRSPACPTPGPGVEQRAPEVVVARAGRGPRSARERGGGRRLPAAPPGREHRAGVDQRRRASVRARSGSRATAMAIGPPVRVVVVESGGRQIVGDPQDGQAGRSGRSPTSSAGSRVPSGLDGGDRSWPRRAPAQWSR